MPKIAVFSTSPITPRKCPKKFQDRQTKKVRELCARLDWRISRIAGCDPYSEIINRSLVHIQTSKSQSVLHRTCRTHPLGASVRGGKAESVPGSIPYGGRSLPQGPAFQVPIRTILSGRSSRDRHRWFFPSVFGSG